MSQARDLEQYMQTWQPKNESSPRDYSIFEKMLQEGTLSRNFRFQGFPNKNMESPRQPVTQPLYSDQEQQENKLMKVFGKSGSLDPAYHDKWRQREAKPTGAELQVGRPVLEYGSHPLNNTQTPRGFKDPFPNKSVIQMRKEREEADKEIKSWREEREMKKFQEEEEKRRVDGNRRRKFLETDVSPRDHPNYTVEPQRANKGHDLFIDTLGGPGGTVVRGDHGYPPLQSMADPRVGAHQSPAPARQPRETKIDTAAEERRIAEQEEQIRQLKRELEFLKSPRGQQTNGKVPAWLEPTKEADRNGFQNGPSHRRDQGQIGNYDFDYSRRPPEQRSLDLDNSRGGAGAPVRDPRGKAITRFPYTMGVDEYGSSKIQEHIPGKMYTLPNDDNPIYDPWGRPGGGAPVKDRQGHLKTNTFGNFSDKKKDSAEQRRQVRASEEQRNELKRLMDEQKKHREDEIRQMKAPYGELVPLMNEGKTGKPKRNEITGTLADQRLPHSDVSKEKTGVQTREKQDQRAYHEDLTQQAIERQRLQELEKLKSRHEANKHYISESNSWGHFGGGAPKDKVIRKKVNLDNALYHYDQRESRSEDLHRPRPQYGLGGSPQHQDDQVLYDPRMEHPYYGLAPASKPTNPSYKKTVFVDDIRHQSLESSPRYLKNTTKSGSKNMYEYPPDRSTQDPDSSPPQAGLPPFATNGNVAY